MPDEWVGTRRTPVLHAATFDIVVHSVLQSIEKYPALTSVAESILLNWNYCSVYHDGKYFDIEVNKGRLSQKMASYDAPRQWQGLTKLGVSATGVNRYIPNAFRNTEKSLRQQVVYNWWEIQHNQCLPHPGTGKLFYKKTTFGPSKITPTKVRQNKVYPYAWNTDCSAHNTEEVKTPIGEEVVSEPNTQTNKSAPPLTLAAALPPKPTAAKKPLPEVADKKPAAPLQPPIPLAKKNIPEGNHPTTRKDKPTVTSIKPPKTPIPLPPIPQVSYSVEPQLSAALPGDGSGGKNLQSTSPQSTGSSFSTGSLPPFIEKKSAFKDRKYHGFSGSFALNSKRLETAQGALSFNAGIGYKPIRSSYYFVRSGFSWTDTEVDPVTYYWGLGYNDWHTDTWAFEINNWGPLKPGDGLSLETAVASISYKFESSFLNDKNLASSFSVSGGKNTDPTATLAASWTPAPNWFIRTLVTQSLEGGDPTWAYGFGYNNWRANTFAIEYNNWGPNRAFYLNFKRYALLSLSWKWSF